MRKFKYARKSIHTDGDHGWRKAGGGGGGEGGVIGIAGMVDNGNIIEEPSGMQTGWNHYTYQRFQKRNKEK